jgi:cysteine desulfurase/selenocysteine lyase
VLYAKQHLLEGSLPFLYGGDMIAEGQVSPTGSATTACRGSTRPAPPTSLGAVVSAQALRLLLDLALSPRRPVYFGTASPLDRAAVREAMGGWRRGTGS